MKNQTLLLNPIPDTIQIVLTESDRLKADIYSCPWGCIIFTALERMGYPVQSVVPSSVYLRDGTYWIIPSDEGDLVSRLSYDERYTRARPFYEPDIVGMEIQLQRCNWDDYNGVE